MIYSKIPTKEIELMHNLEEKSFNLIDTNIKFKRKNGGVFDYKRNESFICSFANKDSMSDISKISGECFSSSRFHLDPFISDSTANKIKMEWTNNYFKGLRGSDMIISYNSKERRVVGFLQLLEINEDLVVDLIGVDPSFHGRGIASDMISFCLEQIPHDNFFVGTQIVNIPSIKLYSKFNFQFHSAEYVFHYHNICK